MGLGWIGGAVAVLALHAVSDRPGRGEQVAAFTLGTGAGLLLATSGEGVHRLWPALAGAAAGGALMYAVTRDAVFFSWSVGLASLAPPILGDLGYMLAN